ncbi:MAG: sulfite exporter TauE/SafE family protein [Aquisalimonadaceae bacterium]
MVAMDLLLLMGICGFVASVLHSLTGFGGALFLAAMLAPLIGIKDAVPVTAAAMIVANVTRVYVFRHDIPWHVVALVVPAAVPGIILGAMLFVGMSDLVVSVLVGAYLVIAVIARHVVSRTYHVGPKTLGSVSAVYGLIGGTTFGAGLMLAPFLLGAGIAGVRLVATVAVCGLVLNLLKSVVFGWSAAFGPAVLVTGLGIGLCTIPGTYVGRWLLGRVTATMHTYILECLLVLVGIYLLQGGVIGMLQG